MQENRHFYFTFFLHSYNIINNYLLLHQKTRLLCDISILFLFPIYHPLDEYIIIKKKTPSNRRSFTHFQPGSFISRTTWKRNTLSPGIIYLSHHPEAIYIFTLFSVDSLYYIFIIKSLIYHFLNLKFSQTIIKWFFFCQIFNFYLAYLPYFLIYLIHRVIIQ